MKPYDEMTNDEQERYLDWAEAEYCQKCGGRGQIARYEDSVKVFGVGNIGGRTLVAFDKCDRCKGTGRA